MRARPKLLWQLYPSFLIVTLLALAAVAYHASNLIQDFLLEHTAKDLREQAVLIGKLVEPRLDRADRAWIRQCCKDIESQTSARVTIVLPSGEVAGNDSSGWARGDVLLSKPEIRGALNGKVTVTERFSDRFNERMLFAAAPVKSNGTIRAVVRTGMPEAVLADALNAMRLRLVIDCLITALLAAAASFYVSHRINRPIIEMRRGAERFAGGELHYRLNIPESEEMALLARSMNSMAAQLHERITTITNQRNELEAVLRSMVEAVIVVDARRRISRVNNAAMELFDVNVRNPEGRDLQEVIRNTDLQRFVQRTLQSPDPVESDLTIIGDPDTFLQAHGTTIRSEGGAMLGALIVLNDVTRLKALENIRKDFVANVSHELRTPVTTIQGFLETLRDGAIEDPVNASRFLDIIMRHTDRLSLIIEDLLSLSRIEQEAGKGQMSLETEKFRDVLLSVHRACRQKAAEKNITLHCECADDLTLTINRTLFEQALVNLVDNAVKYSEPGKSVKVECTRINGQFAVRVVDQGVGIPKEHLNRIFERFYRVDKGRSRKEGGTGLGLAIVKHIVNAHEGTIQVASSPGSGSTFTIRIPVKPEEDS